MRALLFECAPLAVYTALSTTAASLPKIVLQQQMGNRAIGIYGPVTQPVLLLQTGATYLFIPFINVFTDSYAAKDKKGLLEGGAGRTGRSAGPSARRAFGGALSGCMGP